MLITIIENNKLYLFDETNDEWFRIYNESVGIEDIDIVSDDTDQDNSLLNSNKNLSQYEQVFTNKNGSVYVIAKPGDDFKKFTI